MAGDVGHHGRNARRHGFEQAVGAALVLRAGEEDVHMRKDVEYVLAMTREAYAMPDFDLTGESIEARLLRALA